MTPQQWHAQMTAGRARRLVRYNAKIQWFGQRLQQGIQMTMTTRLKMAAQLLKEKVKVNLGRPVLKLQDGSVVPGSRSKPGEFPHAETTLLLRTIFSEMVTPTYAVIGTPLEYGLRLELEMNRSFLRRTLYEEIQMLRMVLLTGMGASSTFAVSNSASTTTVV